MPAQSPSSGHRHTEHVPPALAAKLAVGRVLRRLGLPVEPLYHLMKAGRIARHPAEWARRRRVARALGRTRWASFVSPSSGFGLFAPETLVGTVAAVAACRKIFAAWEVGAGGRVTTKPFLVNVLDPKALRDFPEVLDFALSDAMIEAASGYLGEVPLLRAVALFYSPRNELHQASQKFHIDTDDFRQLKCFVNVGVTDAASGPFTFLEAGLTDVVRTRLNHGWKGGRIEDSDVFSIARPDQVHELTGAPGSGGLVDTSRCLHFGSRARGGDRLVLMFQFTSFAHLKEVDGYGNPDGATVEIPYPDRYRGDALRMLVLGRAQRA